MKKIILIYVLFPILFTSAQPIEAELVMSGGRTWDVTLLKRTGDKLQLLASGRTVGIPVNSISKINFKVNLNLEKLMKLKTEQEFDLLIDKLNQTLKPFKPYSDLPSNLTKYNILLMELYFQIDDFDQSILFAKKIDEEEADERLKSSAQVFHARSLIKKGLADEAEELLETQGWLESIDKTSPANQLFILAELMKVKEEFNRAMELVSYIIAFHSQDADWIRSAELLCAELYLLLDMDDSAAEVLSQIRTLYPNSIENEKAEILRDELGLKGYIF